ncbi:MAG TPA: serine protease [Pirellulales bacterium]|jgi:hypothetical protein
MWATSVALIVFISAPAVSLAAWGDPAPKQTPHPAVVRIVAPEGMSTSYGSGTLVDVRGDYALVLTNWHVVSDAKGTIEVVFPDGFRSAAKVISTDRTWDLAALAIWKPNVAPVPLATEPPRAGEPLSIAGYGSGSYRMASGYCTQYVAPGMNQPYEMVELSAAARQGDSGGPIFNSRGELCGVLFGSSFGTTSGSYCGRVSSFLTSVVPKANLGDPSYLASMRDGSKAAAPTSNNQAALASTGHPATGATDGSSLGGQVAMARPASLPVGRPLDPQPPVSPQEITIGNTPAGARSATETAADSAGPPNELTGSLLGDVELGLALFGAAAILFHGLRLCTPTKKA